MSNLPAPRRIIPTGGWGHQREAIERIFTRKEFRRPLPSDIGDIRTPHRVLDDYANDVEAVIPMLAKVGIKAKPKLVEVTVLTEILMKGDHQALIASSLTGPDSLATLRCYYSKTPRTACNYTGFNNADFDKLLDDAAQEGDMAKRDEILKKASAYFAAAELDRPFRK